MFSLDALCEKLSGREANENDRLVLLFSWIVIYKMHRRNDSIDNHGEASSASVDIKMFIANNFLYSLDDNWHKLRKLISSYIYLREYLCLYIISRGSLVVRPMDSHAEDCEFKTRLAYQSEYFQINFRH